jgi:hypothetical protein
LHLTLRLDTADETLKMVHNLWKLMALLRDEWRRREGYQVYGRQGLLIVTYVKFLTML